MRVMHSGDLCLTPSGARDGINFGLLPLVAGFVEVSTVLGVSRFLLSISRFTSVAPRFSD
jgi:hypothetical protein